MVSDIPTADARSAPNSANANWIKPFTDAPAKFCAGVCKEALRRTANHLQVQSDYVRMLATCDTPYGLLACNYEFLQRSAAIWFQDIENTFEALRRFPSDRPLKDLSGQPSLLSQGRTS